MLLFLDGNSEFGAFVKTLRELNKIDKHILRLLQKDGRMTYAELARQVGLSTTPCMERVKRLEKSGVIRGYTATVDPGFFSAGLVVFVQIRLARKNQGVFSDFREQAIALDEVQECYLVSGNFDYLIKARVADMSAYRRFLGETLLTLPDVQESTSYVVMEEVKETLSVHIPVS